MKLYRMITAVVAAMLAMAAFAQQATLTINDERLHYAITFTAVSDDIVRVDVVPEGWNGTRLQTWPVTRL